MDKSTWPDEEAFRIAVASIKRHSMVPEQWRYTSIGQLRPEIAGKLLLLKGELIVVSAYITDESWYVFTTQRIISRLDGIDQELDPRYGIDFQSGNFKGIGNDRVAGAIPTEVGIVQSDRTGDTLRFEYETNKASMAPIYACMFWSRTTRFRLSMDH
jgi:hypothetical protein